jgi:hypothetical protein
MTSSQFTSQQDEPDDLADMLDFTSEIRYLSTDIYNIEEDDGRIIELNRYGTVYRMYANSQETDIFTQQVNSVYACLAYSDSKWHYRYLMAADIEVAVFVMWDDLLRWHRHESVQNQGVRVVTRPITPVFVKARPLGRQSSLIWIRNGM